MPSQKAAGTPLLNKLSATNLQTHLSTLTASNINNRYYQSATGAQASKSVLNTLEGVRFRFFPPPAVGPISRRTATILEAFRRSALPFITPYSCSQPPGLRTPTLIHPETRFQLSDSPSTTL